MERSDDVDSPWSLVTSWCLWILPSLLRGMFSMKRTPPLSCSWSTTLSDIIQFQRINLKVLNRFINRIRKFFFSNRLCSRLIPWGWQAVDLFRQFWWLHKPTDVPRRLRDVTRPRPRLWQLNESSIVFQCCSELPADIYLFSLSGFILLVHFQK